MDMFQEFNVFISLSFSSFSCFFLLIICDHVFLIYLLNTGSTLLQAKTSKSKGRQSIVWQIHRQALFVLCQNFSFIVCITEITTGSFWRLDEFIHTSKVCEHLITETKRESDITTCMCAVDICLSDKDSYL